MPPALASGIPAPDFTLKSAPDRTVTLSLLRGRLVVLAFYAADFSPVCREQMALYNELLAEFERYDAQLLGVSVDGCWSHLAFAKDRHLRFPLLSDFEPKGEVARRYGVFRPVEGFAERALFLVDRGGTIAWSRLSPIDVCPGVDGILDALECLPQPVPGSGGRSDRMTLRPPVTSRDHSTGPDVARVTVVEYGDYEAAACGAFYPTIKGALARFGQNLRFVFRNFPLCEIHPSALLAAEAAEAAGAQDAFWPMHDTLLENQHSLQRASLELYADSIGLDLERFNRDLDLHAHEVRIRDEVRDGARCGVNGTPTLFVDGLRYDGPRDEYSLLQRLGSRLDGDAVATT